MLGSIGYPTYITFEKDGRKMSIMKEISENVQKGKAKIVKALVEEAIASGASSSEILGALIEGMDVIGEKFKNNEVYVPEVLIAARAVIVLSGFGDSGSFFSSSFLSSSFLLRDSKKIG